VARHKRPLRVTLAPKPGAFLQSAGGRLTSFRWISSATLLFFLISLNVFSIACSWFGQKRLTELERHDLALRIREAIERAGGPEVWIKSGPLGASRTSPSNSADDFPQVLVVSSRFEKLIAAIHGQADADGLQADFQPNGTTQRWRSVEIILTRRNEVVGGWRVREVPRLLRAAIVIDDLGLDLEAARSLLRQPYPLTYSILPSLRHSLETARLAHTAGREVMLHLPMEPEPGSGAQPGLGAISVGMNGEEVARTIASDLTSVAYATGVNNHMGSRATADAVLMAEVMKVLAAQGLFFVDSRTTAQTSALNEARRAGIPAFYRSVFLDDVETVPYTLQQLRVFRRAIEEQGVALAIGHPHPTTIEALIKFLPEFERDEIELVPASHLVRLPEAARLAPPNGGPNVARDAAH
jgi:polysaccharide deacetylase 2 family uncharacterized protein YibQ